MAREHPGIIGLGFEGPAKAGSISFQKKRHLTPGTIDGNLILIPDDVHVM